MYVFSVFIVWNLYLCLFTSYSLSYVTLVVIECLYACAHILNINEYLYPVSLLIFLGEITLVQQYRETGVSVCKCDYPDKALEFYIGCCVGFYCLYFFTEESTFKKVVHLDKQNSFTKNTFLFFLVCCTAIHTHITMILN